MNLSAAYFFQFKLRKLLQTLPLALSVVSLSVAVPALAESGSQPVQAVVVRTLSVTGRGVETVPTTLTQVRLGVEVQGKTAAEVQQEAARRSAAVVALLKSRNVEKLQTTGINLNPTYSYENNIQRLTGYVASNIVSFRLPTEAAGQLLDEAVKAGASRIDGISFIASESAISAAQQKALISATRNAQNQADAVLSALNLSAKEVIGIQINGAYTPPPAPVFAKLASEEANMAGSTPVVGGEQQVEATVTLQIRY